MASSPLPDSGTPGSTVERALAAYVRDEDVRNLVPTAADVAAVTEALREEMEGRSGPLRAARAHWLVGDLMKASADAGESVVHSEDVPAGSAPAWVEHEEEAFRIIGRAVEMGHARLLVTPRLRLAPDEEVIAEAPVRLDLAGGWSDTPPYSLESGGATLNVALLLEGAMPLRAKVRALAKPVVRLHTSDLNAHVTLTRTSEVFDYADPGDPFALHKAALSLLTLVTPDGGPLAEQLTRFGGGLEITTESAVPKGSGLGTSSILGGVVLAALARTMGVELDGLSLFEPVLALEQRLTTGGGWQDQIGGLTGGWKVTTTLPGLRQVPRVERLTLPEETGAALKERALLMYSGHTRLAKNILRNMVSRYLSRDTLALEMLRGMPALVTEMADDLFRGDLDAVGAGLDRNNAAVVPVDPQSWPPHIEQVVAAVRPFICGAKPAGAGGGGFLVMLARSAEDRARAEEVLGGLNLPSGARTYPLEVSTEGLRIVARPLTP